MLIAMTFNFLLFVAVIIGLTIGYTIFGFRKLRTEEEIRESLYTE
jgi:hypothetical protein